MKSEKIQMLERVCLGVLNEEINGNKTYIFGDDGYEVARLKGRIELSNANII